jgi:protein-S-isoprenylcysteine O-methyltransferase Ste14
VQNGTPPKPAKDTAGVIVFPPLVYIAVVVVGWLLNRLLPISLPEWFAPLGLMLVVLSAIPGPWAMLVMLRSGVNPEPHVPTRKLVLSGPFRFTRNPIYLTYVLFVSGLGLLLGNLWMVLLVIPAVAITHYGIILREERYLSRRFGAPYDDYRQRVRRWL